MSAGIEVVPPEVRIALNATVRKTSPLLPRHTAPGMPPRRRTFHDVPSAEKILGRQRFSTAGMSVGVAIVFV
jgi:hypothetical protein